MMKEKIERAERKVKKYFDEIEEMALGKLAMAVLKDRGVMRKKCVRYVRSPAGDNIEYKDGKYNIAVEIKKGAISEIFYDRQRQEVIV
jgi:hypothetical protein